MRLFSSSWVVSISALAVCANCIAADLGAQSDAGRTTFSVLEYGAVPDGKAMNTAAIAKAIDACAAVGGGRVVIPAGTFLTGPIHLQNGVELHVESGATVLFSKNVDDYPLTITSYEGKAAVLRMAPITGENLHDISITGGGTFDGQGQFWRPTKKAKMSDEQWHALTASGGIVDGAGTWWPSNEAAQGREGLQKLRTSNLPLRTADYEKYRELLRPSLMLLSNCRNVLLEGVTFRNSPGWNLHLYLSDNIILRGATIYNPIYAQNGDGIDVDSCREVSITHCSVNAGDDDICLKSGRDEEGRQLGRPTENVTISDCTIGEGHGGVAIGSEMSGGVRNVSVSNCVMKGTEIGLRFKTTRGRGGVVENVNISNIEMTDIRNTAISLNMYYMVKNPQAEPVSERTPKFRQIRISNVTCQGAKQALEIRGLPEFPIEKIVLENIRLITDQPGMLADAKDITLRDVSFETKEGSNLQISNVKNLTSERVDFSRIARATTTQPAAASR